MGIGAARCRFAAWWLGAWRLMSADLFVWWSSLAMSWASVAVAAAGPWLMAEQRARLHRADRQGRPPRTRASKLVNP